MRISASPREMLTESETDSPHSVVGLGSHLWQLIPQAPCDMVTARAPVLCADCRGEAGVKDKYLRGRTCTLWTRLAPGSVGKAYLAGTRPRGKGLCILQKQDIWEAIDAAMEAWGSGSLL